MSDTFFHPDLVAPFRDYSARWGSDPLLVQGAGGNTSLKAGDRMMVKASGKRLEDAERADIFVTVRRSDLRIVDQDAANPLRASIETMLHAAMPHRIVCHVHMVEALAYAVRADGRQALAERLDGLRWGWIPYAKPGEPLAKSIARLAEGHDVPDVLVLGNHGVVIGGDSCEAVDRLLMDVRIRLEETARHSAALPKRLAETAAELSLVPVSVSDAHLIASPANLALARQGSLYPDHVVFLGRGITVVDGPDLPREIPSILFVVPGVGAFLPPNAPQEAHEMAGCLGAVVARIPEGARLSVLSSNQEDELLNWEAEAYRKSLAAAASAAIS